MHYCVATIVLIVYHRATRPSSMNIGLKWPVIKMALNPNDLLGCSDEGQRDTWSDMHKCWMASYFAAVPAEARNRLRAWGGSDGIDLFSSTIG